MTQVTIDAATLSRTEAQGMAEMLQTVADAILASVGGTLNAQAMARLNADQITLIGYLALRDEVMDGGFIQLIHNGWGPFLYRNPFAKAVRAWGLDTLAALINKSHSLYAKHHEAIERDCTDEEFMALYEQMPAFDNCDDAFVENEEDYTTRVAQYVREHLENFITTE